MDDLQGIAGSPGCAERASGLPAVWRIRMLRISDPLGSVHTFPGTDSANWPDQSQFDVISTITGSASGKRLLICNDADAASARRWPPTKLPLDSSKRLPKTCPLFMGLVCGGEGQYFKYLYALSRLSERRIWRAADIRHQLKRDRTTTGIRPLTHQPLQEKMQRNLPFKPIDEGLELLRL